MTHDVDELVQSFDTLLKDGTLPDVTLVVGDRRMPAHRRVLAAQSDYFKTMFTIDLAERRSNDVILNDTSPAAFQPILNYAYTGTLDVKAIDEQTRLEVLELSHRYQFLQLQNAMATHLAETITIDTVCEWLNIAELLNIDILKNACLVPTLVTQLLLKQELVDQLSSSILESVLALDNMQVPEIGRFQAVCSWIEKHREIDARPLLSSIQLCLLTVDELYDVVRPTNHYSKDDIIEAMHKRGAALEFQFPRHLPVTRIEPRRKTFDSSTEEFIMRIYAGRNGLMTINTIQLKLPSHLDYYSYEVDVSSDGGSAWSTVCGQDHCERKQRLYIEPQRVSHLRIRFSTGTIQQCTPLTVIASYSNGVTVDFNAEQRCRAPKHNMATATTARLLPIPGFLGWDNEPDVLFNGDLNSKGEFRVNDPANSLVVRFSQPYYISSLVFLLEERKTYWCSYYVEVSDDKSTWNRVCNKSREQCRGWQVVRFVPQRVVYVRIVSIRPYVIQFEVAHFECPINEARLPQLLKKHAGYPGEVDDEDDDR